MSKTEELDNVIDEVTQERRDKLEALDSNMRLVRRLDEAERARDFSLILPLSLVNFSCPVWSLSVISPASFNLGTW